MALNKPEFYSQASRAALPRVEPRGGPGATVARQLAVSITGAAETLAVGTPLFLAAATGLLQKIVPGSGTAEQKQIFAFVYPVPIDVKATGGGEVLGTVMIAGSAHFEDILGLQTAPPTGMAALAGTQQQLEDVCRDPITRQRGLFIEGINLQGGNSGL